MVVLREKVHDLTGHVTNGLVVKLEEKEHLVLETNTQDKISTAFQRGNTNNFQVVVALSIHPQTRILEAP